MSDHNHVPHAKNRTGVPQGSASAEAAVLQKLMPEYVSLYRIEANSGEWMNIYLRNAICHQLLENRVLYLKRHR